MKTIFVEKNANFEKHGCQNSVAVVAPMLKYTSRRVPDKC